MALNTRSALDPRWAYAHRAVARGWQSATIEVKHPSDSATIWNAVAGDNFTAAKTDYVHYQGSARVQPNNDWRARKNPLTGQNATEHAVRFQLDLTGNQVVNPNPSIGTPPSQDIGTLHKGDIVRIVDMASPFGHEVDAQLMAYQYVIRNISTSSNSWVRTILCDFLVDNVTPGEP